MTKALFPDWKSAVLLFHLTDQELKMPALTWNPRSTV